MMRSTGVRRGRGFLGAVERIGDALPDPVIIFLYLIIALAALSATAAFFGWSARHPITAEPIAAASLFSAGNLRRLVVEMPSTFTHFHPLGYVLTVMLGAGVAERSGLISAAMRAAVRGAPPFLLTPAVAFAGMMGNLAADAAFVVLVPLAGVVFAAAGRHPLAGVFAAFAAVGGGFSANLLPGQLDALLFGVTQTAAEVISPEWQANIAGNWFFIAAMTGVFLPVIWAVTDLIVAPRLGSWSAGADAPRNELSAAEKKGLRRAGIASACVVGLWIAMVFAPGTPLIDQAASTPEARLTPFYRSLVAGFCVLFLASGCAYGVAAGTVKSDRDVVAMMTASMGEMAYYMVLAFAAAHFVALFQWSNLGLILAINGAAFLGGLNLPAPALLAAIVVLSAGVNLFIGSASAKWALLAPVLVPMLMLLGFSPEMATAAYRVGDSVTNIATPIFIYFPLALTFCRRWDKDVGMGGLMASMLPYSFFMLIAGLALTLFWVAFDLPLGPGAPIGYELPSSAS